MWGSTSDRDAGAVNAAKSRNEERKKNDDNCNSIPSSVAIKPNSHLVDEVIISTTHNLPAVRNANLRLGLLLERRRNHTVKTEIIETGARRSRISSFRLGEKNTARKILQPSAETTGLTRRGSSNVLAPVSIISVQDLMHQ